MKFLAIEKELTNLRPQNYDEILVDEAKHAWELKQNGFLKEIYFTENKKAVLIIECEDKDKAVHTLSNLPLVKNQIIDFEIMQLNAYTGFERLK